MMGDVKEEDKDSAYWGTVQAITIASIVKYDPSQEYL
jgi:hypothetical protein